MFDKPEAGKKAGLPISVASDTTLVDPSLGKCQVNPVTQKTQDAIRMILPPFQIIDRFGFVISQNFLTLTKFFFFEK